MTAAGEILRDEIHRSGPLPFRRFMEVALYHPEHGYYQRCLGDPFGREGDFYTAEQIQPVFGLLMAKLFQKFRKEERSTDNWEVVELGAGRAELSEFLTAFRYRPVEVGDSLPATLRGIVFANEFFDALAVDVAVRRSSGWRMMRVGFADNRFHWREAEPVSGAEAEYLERYASKAPEGWTVEIGLEAERWIRRIAGRLEHGRLLVIDYGYTAAELLRFPEGTLMSYRRHRAIDEVLADPGEQDITAHVCFPCLEDTARACGLKQMRAETLCALLLWIGEDDHFATLFDGVPQAECQRRRLQLKTLLFGMGETFRMRLWGKEKKTSK